MTFWQCSICIYIYLYLYVYIYISIFTNYYALQTLLTFYFIHEFKEPNVLRVYKIFSTLAIVKLVYSKDCHPKQR